MSIVPYFPLTVTVSSGKGFLTVHGQKVRLKKGGVNQKNLIYFGLRHDFHCSEQPLHTHHYPEVMIPQKLIDEDA